MIQGLDATYGAEQANRARASQGHLLLEESAEKLADDYGDDWLLDFIRFENSFLSPTASSYLVRAIHENQTGEPDDALSSARNAAQLFRASRNVAGNLRARFEEVYALHRLSHGTECLAAAAALQHRLNATRYRWLQTQVGFELSVCKGLTGDMEGSISEAEDAIARAREYGLRTLVLRGLGLLAELRATNGNEDDAWALTKQGVNMFWSGNFPPMRGYQLYAGIAFSAENRKEWYLATALNCEANAFVEQTGNLSIEAMAHYRLAGDALMAGDNALATEQFSKANSLFASLPQTLAWKAYRAYGDLVLAGLNTPKNQLSRSRELLAGPEHSLSNLPDYVLRLTYLQIEGDVSFRSKQYSAAEKAYSSALTIGKAWLSRLHSDRDRLAWNAQMGNIYRALVRLYALDQKDPARALAVWEEYRSAAVNIFDKSPYPDVGDDWINGITGSLTDKTFLAYVQFEDGLGIWLVDSHGLRFRWQPISASETERKASRLRALCSDRSSDIDELQKLADELYSLLIEPVETQLEPGRILVIEADTSLAGVPFSALRDHAGHYLAERFATVQSPSLAFEEEAQRQTGRSLLLLHALIMAPSAGAGSTPDLLPLRDAILESEEVARHFNRPTLLSRGDATLARFSEDISDSGVFHFAGHAVLRSDAIGLVFSQAPNSEIVGKPALLFAKTVEKESFRHLRLVVLAACSTSGGTEADTMSRTSLVGEFLRAGIPHVIAMGWDVDSATTRTMIEGFYSGLESNLDIANATQSAQLLLLSKPQTRHPYYWAAVVAFGS